MDVLFMQIIMRFASIIACKFVVYLLSSLLSSLFNYTTLCFCLHWTIYLCKPTCSGQFAHIARVCKRIIWHMTKMQACMINLFVQANCNGCRKILRKHYNSTNLLMLDLNHVSLDKSCLCKRNGIPVPGCLILKFPHSTYWFLILEKNV